MTSRSHSLRVAAAPHLHAGNTVRRLLRHTLIALLPATVFAVVLFGLAALATLLVAVVACLLADRLCAGRSAAGYGSALLTGLLLGLSLPPALPLWMVALGGVVAILVGKHLFGGLGGLVFHPALVGRVFLQAAFPLAMAQAWLAPFASGRVSKLPGTSMAAPFMAPVAVYDGISGATPLAAARLGDAVPPLADLWLGTVAGSVGETSAVLLLLGGLYLVAVRAADWRVPSALLATVALFSGALHALDAARYPDVLTVLGSGGLMLGAWFFATDSTSSPMTRTGAWVYGVAIGALVVLIRQFSGQTEGVMYALLLGSALTPHIDRWTRPRPLGRGSGR